MADLSQHFVPIRSVLDDICTFDTWSPHFQMERKFTLFLFVVLFWNFVSYSRVVSVILIDCSLWLIIWMSYKWILMQNRGASDKSISKLHKWRYKEADNAKDCDSIPYYQVECSICLAMFTKNEEIRQLPCSHIFHQLWTNG